MTTNKFGSDHWELEIEFFLVGFYWWELEKGHGWGRSPRPCGHVLLNSLVFAAFPNYDFDHDNVDTDDNVNADDGKLQPDGLVKCIQFILQCLPTYKSRLQE